MNSIHFVASICHPKKLGLIDLAKALQYYGQTYDRQRTYVLLHNITDLKNLLRGARNSGGIGLCIVWDNSLRSLLFALIARLLGVVTAYYYHEPGGFGQKIFKSDPFFYSLMATFGEWAFRKSTNFHIVARPDKIGFGDAFCPLIFDDRRPIHELGQKKIIGFLGARRNQRLFNLFNLLVPDLKKAGYLVAFFPSKEYGSSNEEKFAFLSQCTAVWNVYGVPYNQSGVTGDCLMSSTPVIYSAFEPYGSLLRELDLGIELDLMQPQPELARHLLDELERMNGMHKKSSDISLSKVQSDFGGRGAFVKYWLPFFASLQGSKKPYGRNSSL